MKRILIISLMATLVIMMVLGACTNPAPAPAPEALPEILVIGTNPTSSNLYTLGVAVADFIGKHTPMKVEITPVGGSGYFPLFATKEVDFALQTADEAWTAYAGEADYKERTQGKGYDMSTLLVGGMFQTAPMVKPSSGLHELKDVKGKRYAQMTLIYGSTLATSSILANVGLSWDDVITVPVTGLPQASEALLEGLVDVHSAAIGSADTAKLLSAGCYVLPLDPSPEAVARMVELFPAYGVAEAPPAVIGLQKPAYVATKPFLLLTRPGLSQNVVDALLEAFWTYSEELGSVHPIFKTLIPRNFASSRTAVPFSEEAINWYKAKGVWTSELEQMQKQISK